MEKRYFIHRISHEWEASYPLLDMGYLSIGWSCYMDSDLLDRIENEGEGGFNQFMAEKGNSRRNRWSLWYFSQFKPGDYVVVPRFGKEFAVCKVLEKPKTILSLSGVSINREDSCPIIVNENGLVSDDGKTYDIGFVVMVEVLKIIPRTWADAYLISRMKIRQTTARIDDLSSSVEYVAKATGPIDVHERMMESLFGHVKNTIDAYITPDDLEETVRWYLLKKGADDAWIPSKNEPGKENGADADVVAVFNDLGLIYYIQVKKHDGKTDEWAVNQVVEYCQQQLDKQENDKEEDDMVETTYVPWVVSMADGFSEAAVEKAKKNHVRLIDGKEFIRMLLDVGIHGMENVKKK